MSFIFSFYRMTELSTNLMIFLFGYYSGAKLTAMVSRTGAVCGMHSDGGDGLAPRAIFAMLQSAHVGAEALFRSIDAERRARERNEGALYR